MSSRRVQAALTPPWVKNEHYWRGSGNPLAALIPDEWIVNKPRAQHLFTSDSVPAKYVNRMDSRNALRPFILNEQNMNYRRGLTKSSCCTQLFRSVFWTNRELTISSNQTHFLNERYLNSTWALKVCSNMTLQHYTHGLVYWAGSNKWRNND